ncbi:MAG TPA: hypothetical protein VMO26_21580 [Vicinamibacterales bacterium]|nr:hypothetical protein [Vicinamibacterales bacterium]
MSALLIASHPAPVGDAIARYREELDRDPVLTLREHNRSRQRAVQDAAAGYLGADGDDIVLTDSTTMGVGLMYNGLRLRLGDEIRASASRFTAFEGDMPGTSKHTMPDDNCRQRHSTRRAARAAVAERPATRPRRSIAPWTRCGSWREVWACSRPCKSAPTLG